MFAALERLFPANEHSFFGGEHTLLHYVAMLSLFLHDAGLGIAKACGGLEVGLGHAEAEVEV